MTSYLFWLVIGKQSLKLISATCSITYQVIKHMKTKNELKMWAAAYSVLSHIYCALVIIKIELNF